MTAPSIEFLRCYFDYLWSAILRLVIIFGNDLAKIYLGPCLVNTRWYYCSMLANGGVEFSQAGWPWTEFSQVQLHRQLACESADVQTFKWQPVTSLLILKYNYDISISMCIKINIHDLAACLITTRLNMFNLTHTYLYQKHDMRFSPAHWYHQAILVPLTVGVPPDGMFPPLCWYNMHGFSQ